MNSISLVVYDFSCSFMKNSFCDVPDDKPCREGFVYDELSP